MIVLPRSQTHTHLQVEELLGNMVRLNLIKIQRNHSCLGVPILAKFTTFFSFSSPSLYLCLSRCPFSRSLCLSHCPFSLSLSLSVCLSLFAKHSNRSLSICQIRSLVDWMRWGRELTIWRRISTNSCSK